ncbi:MAG: AAA family ATPase [Candidatus Hatepunaea meridiana]|nr:AAA family ATPase [Candidatus Hatepunaea meridiana]
MHNLIPSFILEKYNEGKSHGSFKTATMFIDISGFTAMTQELMQNGKEGAEVLNSILTNIFEPVIDAVYDRGGFITSFAGDAFTAIFSDIKRPLDCCNAAMKIQQIFSDISKQDTRFGVFNLAVKIGLAYGRVDWGIVGFEKLKTYFFRGPAINKCAMAEHRCDRMQIVLHKGLSGFVSDALSTQSINKTYSLLTANEFPEANPKPLPEFTGAAKALRSFIPDAVLNYKRKGEFRQVVNVFISFKELSSFESLDRFTISLLENAERFGGYFRVLDFGDKGGNCLTLFGAPVSHENNIQRAVDFVEAVRNEFGDDIRAGVTFGTVFAGFVGSRRRRGYDVLGNVVNLSARFMMKAEWGEIYLDKAVARSVREEFNTVSLKPGKYKGFVERVPQYKLSGREKQKEALFFAGKLVGRKKELTRLKRYLKPVKDGKFGGIVYVYGAPGIGKSRLIHELVKASKIHTYTMQCDSILKKSLNPFSYFLTDYFRQSGTPDLNARKEIYTSIYNDLVDKSGQEHTKELRRIESIIGSIIGLHWEGSIYEIIEAKDRPTVVNFGLKSFISILCSLEPLILLIEDIQWIDETSQEALQILTRQIEDVPFMILASSRFNDDGSRPTIKCDDDVKQREVVIDNLSTDSVDALIENNLEMKPSPELVQYIQSRAEGNPFYIEQFCLYLKENDHITVKEDGCHLTTKPVDIPVDINAVIIARVDRLSSELKEVVQVASVLGREFEVQVLEEILSLLKEKELVGE